MYELKVVLLPNDNAGMVRSMNKKKEFSILVNKGGSQRNSGTHAAQGSADAVASAQGAGVSGSGKGSAGAAAASDGADADDEFEKRVKHTLLNEPVDKSGLYIVHLQKVMECNPRTIKAMHAILTHEYMRNAKLCMPVRQPTRSRIPIQGT